MQLSAGTDYYNYPKGWIREYQRRSHTFAGISGYSLNVEYNVTGGGTTGRAFGSTVNANLFDTLGVRPALGRFFSPAEETLGQDRVIVLSNGFWQAQFGGDPNVVGRTMMLDGVNRQIIGIAPPQIRFPGLRDAVLDSHRVQSRRPVRSLGADGLRSDWAAAGRGDAQPGAGRTAVVPSRDAGHVPVADAG